MYPGGCEVFVGAGDAEVCFRREGDVLTSLAGRLARGNAVEGRSCAFVRCNRRKHMARHQETMSHAYLEIHQSSLHPPLPPLLQRTTLPFLPFRSVPLIPLLNDCRMARELLSLLIWPEGRAVNCGVGELLGRLQRCTTLRAFCDGHNECVDGRCKWEQRYEGGRGE